MATHPVHSGLLEARVSLDKGGPVSFFRGFSVWLVFAIPRTGHAASRRLSLPERELLVDESALRYVARAAPMAPQQRVAIWIARRHVMQVQPMQEPLDGPVGQVLHPHPR